MTNARPTLTVTVVEGPEVAPAELQRWVERFVRLVLDNYGSQQEEGN